MSGFTQECCCTYNMLKLTRHVFSWTADPAAPTITSGPLQRHPRHPASRGRHDRLLRAARPPATGSSSAYRATPSGAARARASRRLPSSGQRLLPGRHRPLREPVRADDAGLARERLVSQDTRFPDEETTPRLEFQCEMPVTLSLRIRVPLLGHAGDYGEGQRRSAGGLREAAASYWTVERTWKTGDRLEVSLPMSLHVHPMPDDPTVKPSCTGHWCWRVRWATRG